MIKSIIGCVFINLAFCCNRAKHYFSVLENIYFHITQRYRLPKSPFMWDFSDISLLYILHLSSGAAPPASLKKNFTSFEENKNKKIKHDSFLLFICLPANNISQASGWKKTPKKRMYHIFHIFFILKIITLQATFLHIDNKKYHLSIISFGKQFVFENKVALPGTFSYFISAKDAYLFPLLFKVQWQA